MKKYLVAFAVLCALFLFVSCNPEQEIVKVSSVSLDKTELQMIKGNTGSLSVTVSPSDAADKSVTWKSSNDSVATVDQDGKVTAVSVGTATISATSSVSTIKGTCEVTVYDYFTLSSTAPFSVTPSYKDTGSESKLWYSLDGENWVEIPKDNTESISSGVGKKIIFRGSGNNKISGYNVNNIPNGKSWKIDGDGGITASGNIMSLLNYEDLSSASMGDCCFRSMFLNCTSLLNAPELPSTTLANYCYYSMFKGCTGLTEVPALPATSLEKYSYASMFSGCTSLTTVPTNLLPATSLEKYCYNSMFYGCTKLNTAPALPATTLAECCYYMMFYGCTSLKTAPALSATILDKSCYKNMFYGCTSLITAPALLPAQETEKECYYSMFFNCTSLLNAPALPATTLAESCYYQMFYGCTSLTSAPVISATDLSNSNCTTNMFNGCTSLVVSTSGGEGKTLFLTSPTNVDGANNMFTGTKGGITKPAVGTSYYFGGSV